MIRPFRSETERYGPFTTAGETVYDRPFQFGSKRTGPDLARVGGRYSDDWHRLHLTDPRALVPESNMPGYPWLLENTVDPELITTKLKALQSSLAILTPTNRSRGLLPRLKAAPRWTRSSRTCKNSAPTAGIAGKWRWILTTYAHSDSRHLLCLHRHMGMGLEQPSQSGFRGFRGAAVGRGSRYNID